MQDNFQASNPDVATIAVSLTHGHLRHAQYPLAVGHYRHDVIVSAEAALNEALDNVLRERFDLGRYPGPLGTVAIVRHAPRPKGAIVVGLGDVGELTPQRLRETFAVALKEYALDVARDPQSPVTKAGYRSAAFSTLLVGTDGGGSGTLADAIFAILRAAIDTNRALRNSGLIGRVRIDAVEFVELFEDTATRAAHVIADLPGALERELKPDEGLTGSRRVSTVPGSRYLRPPSPYAVGWWQRIGVEDKAPAGGGPRSDTATQLKFTVLTDRARLEQDVTTGQRALVQELVTSATASTAVDLELSASLYQLLVPHGVRDRISQGSDVLFMLDRGGAGFPFELMASRGNDGQLQPLIDRHGILRQFATEQYDTRPEMARTNRLFLIGNPKTLLWPSLPGAEKEAAAVKKVAEAHGVQVTHPQRDAQQMVTSLMTGEYQIVHIAAHGQYDPDPMKSGVVISDRLFITPAEVARLPLVPELVFLNCCYLGKMGDSRPSSPDPRLASSLAEGFIRAGARAVIAAGWAVDDNAGTTFATTFYEEFLSGASFGDAVKLARQATRVRHRSNTWGAYQCYGNPDFRFRARSAPQAPARAPSLVTRAESLQALRTLASSARNMSVDDVPWLAEQFAVTFGAIEADWREEGELLTVAAEITGELDDFAQAIDYYGQALGSKKASAPVQAAEQLANLLGRHAAMTAMMTGTVDAGVREAFQRAEEWLDWLDQKLPPTGERRSLRGSLYKRMAASLPDRRLEYLAKARDSYGVGAAATAEYQSLNALALAFVLADAPMRATLVVQADAFWEGLAQQAPGADRDFWDLIKTPDTLLHRQVLRQSLDAAALAELTTSYEQAWLARPSPRQWASVTDHIWFLQAMTADARLPCRNPKTSAALKQLHDILLKRSFQPASRAQDEKRTTARGRTRAVAKTARPRRPAKSARARARTKGPKR
jgi:CHAT domain-containing protein